MYMIDILGLKILYTGDYSREDDRHLVKAEIPPVRPDVLVVESTHGVHTLETRADKELRFTALVHAILRRGGHVLLPVFALGMAQELLLVLEAYWEEHPDLQSVPIYYTSSLARKCMAVYQTHIHAMNDNIRSRFAKRDNPFVFKWVSRARSCIVFIDFCRHVSSVPPQRGWMQRIAQGPPCVVLASPGFMDSGNSRELFELWAPDPRNGLIITGYSIEGTLAKVSGLCSVVGVRLCILHVTQCILFDSARVAGPPSHLGSQSLLNEPDDILTLRGERIPCKISIDSLSFSAHVDYSQNSEFIELINAEHVASDPLASKSRRIMPILGSGAWRADYDGSFTHSDGGALPRSRCRAPGVHAWKSRYIGPPDPTRTHRRGTLFIVFHRVRGDIRAGYRAAC